MTDIAELEREERWAELFDALAEQARAATDGRERIHLLTKAAMLAEEQLGDIGRAAEAYREILEEDPHNLDAIDELDRILTVVEDWATLLAVLETKTQVILAPEQKVDLLVRRASIAREKLGDVTRATGLCQEALALDPHNPAAQELAEELLNE